MEERGREPGPAESVESVEIAPGYRIPRLVVGAWQLSEGHRRDPTAREEALERMVAMADLGLTAFDCADIYTGVEELLGDFLRRWSTTSGGHRPVRVHTKLVPDLSRLADVDRTHVRQVVERSLRRLGVEALDLVQFYWWDLTVGDWLDAAAALRELQEEGKVRHVGVTNLTADEIAALEEGAGLRVVTDQVQYSALDRRPEGSLRDRCVGGHTGILAYGALAGGFLTPTWEGASPPADPGALPNRSLVKYRLIIDEFGGWEAYQALLAELAAVGRQKGVTSAQVALRFVLDQPGVAAALVGFSSVARMRENLRALAVELAPEDHARIRRHTRAAPGPGGGVFGLERDREGPHGRIMKYDLGDEGA